MAELKLGTQIGGNLVWHQGILDLNPVDDKLFFRQFDVITDIGGQTINGGLSLKGDVDTTGRVFGVGANGSWASSPKGAFSQIIENDSSAHWLMTSNRKDGSARAGIQVLTSNTGIMRLYTDNISKYVDVMGGQVSVQATMPSSPSHLTRKDYVDAEVKRSMDYTDTKDAASTKAIDDLDKKVGTLDAQNVKISGNQTIAGTKTFSSHIAVPAADPTVATQAAHKGYVDKLNATSVKGVTAISPIISTGGINPVISIAPATRASFGSMSSDDKIKLDDLPADALSRSGGTMKNNGIIKLDGVGGITSITGGKEYSIFRDHNNGNVTVSGAGGDLYIGYKTDAQIYTTKDVLLYSTMKWSNSGRVLVDSDGFIPWASVKDRIGLEGKSKQLRGPIDFDNLNLTGDYNLYLAKATGSKNPPPFDYGTMSVVGSEKDGATFVTQMATDQRTNIVYVRTRTDSAMTWTAWKENLNEDSDVGYGYHTVFTVGGDAATFYPVVINLRGATDGFSWKRYCFSRHYAATAPESWNNKTHKGGLTFEFQMTNDGGWGGNSHNINVNEFSQSYTTVCGGLALSANAMIVWLRGGGAEYKFHSDEGNKGGVVVYLDRFIAADKKEFLTRNMEQATAANLSEIMPRWSNRSGEVWDRNRRVMLPDSDVGLTIRNSAPMIQFVETDVNDKTYIMVADGGGIRMQEDSTGVGGKIIYQYTPSWEGINLLKPFVDAMGTGTKSLVTKEYSDDQDAKRVAKTGDTLSGSMIFNNDSQLTWSRNTDWAKIGFKNDSDSDVDSFMWFEAGDNGNEYFKFRSKSGTTNKDILDLRSNKAEFHIPIVADEVKNAINVHGRGSISFADASNTRFHLWADGNAFRLNHGVNAETNIISVLPDGNTSSIGSFTAKDFIQTTAQTDNAAASTRKDYVDAQDAKRVAKTGDTMTGNLTVTKVLLSAAQGTEANSAARKDYVDAVDAKNVAKAGDTMTGLLKSTVAGNAIETLGGYVRSNRADVMSMDGKTYSFVTSPSDSHLCQNAYWDGSWKKYNVAMKSVYAVCKDGEFIVQSSNATSVNPLELNPLKLSFDGNLTIAKAINAGGAIQGLNLSAVNMGNPLMELHRPGNYASMIWLNGVNGELNVARSNGSGGEVRRMATWEPTTSHLRNYGGISIPSFSCSWGAYSPSGGINPLNDEARIATGEWHPLLTSPRYIHNTQGYASRWSIGHYRDLDNRNGSFVINMTGDGYLRNNQRFHFTDLGQLTAGGTHDGGWWTAHSNGFDCSRLGGNIIDWVLSNFTSKGNVVEWQGIGSYAFLGRFDQGGAVGAGGVLPGSSLWYTQAEGTANSGHPPGSWRCCGYTKGERDYGSWNCTVWQRVA